MTEKDLDTAIEMCERIMEMDTRTMQNPVSENGWLFEKVYDLLKFLRELPSAQPVEDIRAMCGECDAWNKYKNYPSVCEDAVPRTSVEYICRKNTVSTNPYEHKYHDKFIQFMNDPEISDFGRWQHSNGFNTALVAVMCDLDKVPSVAPKQRWIPCSKRLPEPGEYYFVTRQYFGWNCTEYREIDIAKYDSDGWHKGDNTSSITVLAWCELDVLKPWEGEEHGET